MPGAPPLAGRAVLLTGAASGIGRETARQAAAAGASIGALDVDGEGLDALVEELGAVGRQVDVADPAALTEAVDALAAELGPLQVVHANAGVLTHATAFEDLALEEWHRVLAVDLTGVLVTFQAALPHLDPAGALLLATGSSLAIRPGTGLLPYVAAKAAVHAVARSLAVELAPRNIRVNVLAPGLTDTAMTRGIDGHLERQLAGVPQGALVEAADVAALAVHLMTDASRSVTGGVFPIDGGRTAV